MSLIADALKKAQASRLTRRYRTGEPTGALPVVEEKKRGGFRESINSLLKGRSLSPTLGIGLACGVVLFLVLFVYFFYGPGQKVKSSSSSLAVKKRPVDLILTPPPSVPALEPLEVEKVNAFAQQALGREAPLGSDAELVAGNEKSPGRGQGLESTRRARRKAIRRRATNAGVTVTSDLSDEVRHRFNLALSYQEKRDFLRARKEYEKVIQIWPLYAEAHNNLGLVYKELGKHGQAISHFERALALNPSYVRAYHNLGVIYHLRGDLKRAIKNYHSALSLDRGNLSSLNNLGLVYREEERLYDAREVLEKALNLKPAFPQTQYNLALVLEGLGEYEQARIHYQKFVALTGQNNRALAERVEAHLRELAPAEEVGTGK